MPTRLPRIGRKTGFAIALLSVVVVVALVFDWNWFRHPAEQYFIKRAHRDVRIADLHIHINPNLEPTVRLRGLYVENASWADSRPFVSAAEVSFTFSLDSIWQRRPIVSKLVLIDADIDLERQADGHRNWRLRNPENTARGRMKVRRLEARNTRIRFIRRDVNFEIVAASAPLEQAAQNAAGALTSQILFQGSFEGAEFSGEAHTSDVITIMESGVAFPIRGHMEAGNTRLDVDGAVADLFRPSSMEGKVRLAGTSLAGLHPFVRGKLPRSRAYEVRAQLEQKGEATSSRDVRLKIGGTRLIGDVSYDRSGERPLLKAALRSEAADFDDLGSLAGVRPTKSAGRQAQDKDEASMPGKSRGAIPRPIFSDKALPLKGLNALDAEVSLALKKLKSAGFPALESLKLTADLKSGVLSLKPVDIGVAEGNLTGSFVLDGRDQPVAAALKIEGRDLRVEKLLAGSRMAGHAAGPASVHLALKGSGASIAGLAGSASGSAGFSMNNGVVSKLADAVLELDLGKALRAVMSGNQAIAVNKLDVAFDFDRGMGHARNMFLDTERSRVVGTGTIDLRKEEFALVLTPHPKKPGLFALDKAIQVSGAIRKPKIAVVEPDEGASRTSRVSEGPTENHTR